MSRSDDKLVGLAAWAHEKLPLLRHEASSVVAGLISDRLLEINSQLGTEVGDDSPGPREVIVTAFSEPGLFPLVNRIVGLLADIPGWHFVALKPPRGFGFKLSVGGTRIDAKELAFVPIADVDAGIQLLLSPSKLAALPVGHEAEELGWLIVETGIGEELAGRLQHVEFCSAEAVDKSLPISELESYARTNWPSRC